MIRSHLRWAVLALCLVSFVSSNALSQDFGFGPGFDFGGEKKKSVTIAASFEPGKQAGQGTLILTAKIDPGWHIYSTSQKRGGPAPTKITLAESTQYKPTGLISYSPKPTVKKYEFWPSLDVEEHEGQVTWRIELQTTTATPTVHGVVSLQTCDAKRCIPAKIKFSTSGS
jgi:DsbC/DsbD-like thiol-disulfide interchange protein